MKPVDKADIVLKNGHIYSVDGSGIKSEYSAMAVLGEKILTLGTDESMDEVIGETTTVIDLNGKSVLPGLADSHIHVSNTAEILFDLRFSGVDFAPEKTREDYIREYQEQLKAYIDGKPGAKIIRGAGWNPLLFMTDPKGQPTAFDLDKVCDTVPVMLHSFDHHFLWVNTKALELAGITKETVTPRNGKIERYEDGSPNGIFQEMTAIDLLVRNLPGADYTVDEYKESILYYQKEYGYVYGETLLFDAYCSANAIQAYIQLIEEGSLNCRIKTSFYADPALPESQFDEIIAKCGKYDMGNDFAVNTVKFFVDGVGLSYYFNEPLEKEWLESIGLQEGYRGYPQWTQEELNKYFLKVDNAGMQIHVHCMADGANTMALNAFEYVAQHNDIRKKRHTIAHVMRIEDDDIQRMSQMGVIAAIQPMWCSMDSISAETGMAMMGAERVNTTYRFGSMKKAGCILSCGTDFPVTIPPSPFVGIQTAMTRMVNPVHPEYERYDGRILGSEAEKLELKDLIEGYSIASAYQCFVDDVTGSLEKGKSADFVILDKDITQTDVKEMWNIKVEKTFFKGREVYSLE